MNCPLHRDEKGYPLSLKGISEADGVSFICPNDNCSLKFVQCRDADSYFVQDFSSNNLGSTGQFYKGYWMYEGKRQGSNLLARLLNLKAFW